MPMQQHVQQNGMPPQHYARQNFATPTGPIRPMLERKHRICAGVSCALAVAGVPMVIIVNNTDAVKASSAREALTILAILVSVPFAGLIAIFLFMLRGIAATFIVNGLRRLFGIPPGLTRHGGPALGGGSVGGYGDFGGGFSGDGGGGGGKW